MKMRVRDLTIFGGPPAFRDELHVDRPDVNQRQRLLEYVNNMLDRRWLTNDVPYVREFEQRIADFVGVKHCIATCNGTVALEIAARAAALTGEVTVPVYRGGESG